MSKLTYEDKINLYNDRKNELVNNENFKGHKFTTFEQLIRRNSFK